MRPEEREGWLVRRGAFCGLVGEEEKKEEEAKGRQIPKAIQQLLKWLTDGPERGLSRTKFLLLGEAKASPSFIFVRASVSVGPSLQAADSATSTLIVVVVADYYHYCQSAKTPTLPPPSPPLSSIYLSISLSDVALVSDYRQSIRVSVDVVGAEEMDSGGSLVARMRPHLSPMLPSHSDDNQFPGSGDGGEEGSGSSRGGWIRPAR